MAAFKIGLTAGPSLFHYFLFKYVATHPTALYLGIAALYAVGVTLFCLFVKEGEYPPLTAEQLAEKARPWRERLLGKFKGLGVFVKESFCGRIYIYRYCFTICVQCAACAGVFGLYMFQKMGLTDDLIGKMNGLCGIIGTVSILVVSVLLAEVVNRWHPLRVETYYYFYVAVTLPLSLRWLFGVIPPQVYVWVSVVGSIFGLCLSGMFQICSLPSIMVLFPKSRFGSFCSMQALLRSTCFMLMSIVAGGVFDLLKAHYAAKGDANFAYLYASPWGIPWYLLATLFAFLLYREWGRNGGLKNYAAPASWEASGREPMEPLPVKPVSPTALRRSLPFIDAVFLLFTILLPLYALWHCRWRAAGEPGLLRHYLVAPTILALAADAIWLGLRLRLARLLRRIIDGTEENCGLPHPGMTMVALATYTTGILTTLYSNIYATGVLGYATNIMIACTMVCLAVMLELLARMEHGIPQPDNCNN